MTALAHDTIVAFIAEIFERRGAESYLGEQVTMSQHMLQAAQHAERAGADDELVAAALLHDIGQYTSEFGPYSPQDTRDNVHEVAGARVLAPFFPPRVTQAVRLHVAAKRYLCATDAAYWAGLSTASKHTLELQGGPMTPAQVAAFRTEPHHEDAVRVRRWDDAAKDPAVSTPGFMHYAGLLERVVAAHALDTTQYTLEHILEYERIYGQGFISPGGLESTREIVPLLNLQPGQQVLDVGSGLGGAAFHMALHCGAHVHGLDFSHNMVTLAQQRLQALGPELQALVTLAHGDILDATFDAQFDLVYSRDAFLHIHDKPRLFQVLHRALKPGGRLFFTDYCRGAGELSAAFRAYVAERGYDLHTPQAYGELIARAGFTAVLSLDKTAEFGAILRAELARMPADAALAGVRRSWEEKLERNQRGEQAWGWFLATKIR
jgi:phosphonate degradation associated HDIG domain protein